MAAAVALIFGSCTKDSPFDIEDTGATGTLLGSALKVTMNEITTKATTVDLNDVTVAIYQEGSETAYRTYKYSQMPEIVTLPVGNYTAKATYGENLAAAFNNPYLEGETAFTIKKDEITDKVEPIVCKIVNVKVTIRLSESLKAVAESNCRVDVKVGEVGSLVYTMANINADEAGFFRYDAGSNTLAATFTGTVDGANVSETRAVVDVQPGKHYIITFNLHDAGEEGPGGLTSPDSSDLIVVDATYTTTDINGDVDLPDDEYQDDNMRPTEGGDNGEDPNEPDDPVDPEGPAPQITAEGSIVLGQPNQIPNDNSNFPVVLDIHSDADGGLTYFMVHVAMENVSDKDLESLGLAADMNLINPDPAYRDGLVSLQFPIEEQVAGQKDVKFDISTFVPMLKALGNGTHSFTLTVGDANGKTTASLILSYHK